MGDDFLSNLLAEAWKEMEMKQPEIARKVIELVDDGVARSKDYYEGYNEALCKAGRMYVDMTDTSSPAAKVYAFMVAYTDYMKSIS